VANGVLRAVKRRGSKLPQEKLPRCFSPWLWTKLRRKDARTNQREQRQPMASFPATLHLQRLTPDSFPEFPESTCETISTRPSQRTAPARQEPRVLPNHESFLPSPTGRVSWKLTHHPRW